MSVPCQSRGRSKKREVAGYRRGKQAKKAPLSRIGGVQEGKTGKKNPLSRTGGVQEGKTGKKTPLSRDGGVQERKFILFLLHFIIIRI